MSRTARKTIIAGNWKMNKTPSEALAFGQALRELLPKDRQSTVVLCPPAVSIPGLAKGLKRSRVKLGGQNMSMHASGAHTGEISAEMLLDVGCEYVILGHSERRAMGETDEEIRQKAAFAIENGLRPIICVGESLAQRERGLTKDFISMQVRQALYGLTVEQIRKCVIAYEPLWAIGTGVTATPEQAQEVCADIRGVLRALTDARTARSISILYGGSMNEKNAAELLACPDVDGGLIGGASLDPEKFLKIIEAAE